MWGVYPAHQRHLLQSRFRRNYDSRCQNVNRITINATEVASPTQLSEDPKPGQPSNNPANVKRICDIGAIGRMDVGSHLGRFTLVKDKKNPDSCAALLASYLD